MQDLEALRVGLHHPVLDAVVDHLHVVASARRADVQVAVRRSERPEDGLERLHRIGVATDHQAEAVGQALFGDLVVSSSRVVEVRVSAVDDRVARLQELHQLVDLGLRRVARRHHDPDGARLLELPDQLLERVRALGPLTLDLLRLLRGAVVGHDVVAVPDEPPNHVGAHPA